MGTLHGGSLPTAKVLQWKAAALGWESPESLCRWAAHVAPETTLLALTLGFSCLSSYLGAGPCLALLWGQCWAENKSWLHGERPCPKASRDTQDNPTWGEKLPPSP